MRQPVALIISRSFPHYREALLSSLVESRSIRWHFAADGQRDPKQPVASNVAVSRLRFWSVPFIDLPVVPVGVLSTLRRVQPDAVVLEGNAYWPSHWLCMFLVRMCCGSAVLLLWTQGWRPQEGRLPFVRRVVRNRFYAMSDGLLLYGTAALRRLRRELPDTPGTVIWNSGPPVGTPSVSGARPDALQLLVLGRLTPRKNVPWVVAAVSEWWNRHQPSCPRPSALELMVIGDGADWQSLKSWTSHNDGLSIRLLGGIHDARAIEDLGRQCQGAIFGGAVGLNLIHALAMGLRSVAPINDTENGPEIEALVPGVNGFAYRVGETSSFMTAMDALVCLQGEQSRRQVAESVARYQPAAHAAALERAVLGAL